jgi:murein DD-endopeptidase MepM/ murein hydrolase activator NlpD
MVAALLGASAAGPVSAQVPTSSSSTTPTSVVPTSAPVTTLPPTTTPPTTTSTSSSTSTVAPSSTSSSAPTTSTSEPTTTTSSTVPPTGDDPPPGGSGVSVSDSEVAAFLDSMERTPASSTGPLLDALRPLLDLGLSADEVVKQGMGRFPVGGEAYYRDDFLEFRAGPPVHGHQGNDIWAAFDAPVRSPADGVVRFEEGGLGGKGAFVTEPDGTFYYLAHLNGYAPELTSGMRVTTGQVIAFNGDSGNAKGGPPHVHFEIHPRGGPAVNPKPILDQWLADAIAAVPALLASYLPTSAGNRPVSAVGMARHFDGGLLASRPRGLPTTPETDVDVDEPELDAKVLAEALVEPLTPPVLRSHTVLPLP